MASDLLALLSGADLSGTRLTETTLGGALWSDRTIWPEAAEAEVRRRSERLATGGYRIRPGRGPTSAAELPVRA